MRLGSIRGSHEIASARSAKQHGNLVSLTKTRDEEENMCMGMTAVGFEPTQLALVELESTPLDHSGKQSLLRFTHLLQ